MINLAIGIIIGVLTGLVPGIHSNTILSVLKGFGYKDPIFSTGIYSAHSIFAYFQSVFLGVPDEEVGISLLPGQKLAKEGRGLEALRIIFLSILLSIAFSVVLAWLIEPYIKEIYYTIKGNIVWILVSGSLLLILRERNRLVGAALFVICGLYGLWILNSGIRDPFYTMFIGAFTIPYILENKKRIDSQQKDTFPEIKNIIIFSGAGVFLGLFADFIPGMSSPGQVAAIVPFLPSEPQAYLSLIVGIAMSENIFSFITMDQLNIARIGGVKMIVENMPAIDGLNLFLFSSGLCALLFLLTIKKVQNIYAKIGSKPLLLVGLFVVVAYLINGLLGVIGLGLSTAIGYTIKKAGVKRVEFMGSIIVPTILYYI